MEKELNPEPIHSGRDGPDGKRKGNGSDDGLRAAPEPAAQPSPSSAPKPKAAVAQRERLPFPVPQWRVGQAVTYDMRGGERESRQYTWTLAVVDKEPDGGLWLEMRVVGEDQYGLAKMLTSQPQKSGFRDDPARVFFGVSAHSKPKRTIVQDGKEGRAVEVDLDNVETAPGPDAVVPPASRWTFEADAAEITYPGGTLAGRRFFVSEGEDSFFEGWHCADVPITGLARMRARQLDGKHFEMRLLKIVREGAKSEITGPIVKLSELANQGLKPPAGVGEHVAIDP